ncbi:luciferin 4-monooxygenase isoform X2 [Solenopsis invicta]|uniref:luciferin 4-monooxygenase isoform X2 n=1 Tax=Solenopsis invicta TaxID=13686 RepID=UPI00193E11A8|nr:luciferin 4-monooxygenase isoform X2 [Solenopsis invicta]
MSKSNEKANEEYVPSFRIEDNILIGAEETHSGCTNIGELVLGGLRNKPDFIGQLEIESGKESIYAEMTEQSIKCALWLRKQGIQKGDKIGIWTHNHIDTYIPVFASLYVAAVICPWDHKVSKVSARYGLSLTSPKIVFVNAESVKNLAEAAKEENLEVKVVVIGNQPGFVSLTDILQDQVDPLEIDEFRCTTVDPHDTAMICPSSGTTGMPKGTELSYVSLYNNITAVEEVHMINEVTLSIPTIRWHYGLCLMFELILSNAKWIIPPQEEKFNEAQVCKAIQDHKVTWHGCDIGFPNRLVKYNILQDYPMPSLKKLVITGGPLTKKTQETIAKIMPHTKILNCYGLTDAGGLCASQAKNSKPGSCGFVTKGIRMKVVDEETGKAVGPNKRGWLHTKDIVYYDEDGEIFFVSRISDFISVSSCKVSPAEIEGILETHPSVLNAVVVPVPHEVDIEHPMAFIQKVIGKEVTIEELHDLVDNTLPSYCKLKGGIKFIDKLPRGSTGKIDRKQLKLLAKSYVN